RGNNLILGVRGDNLDRYVLETGEEYSLPHIGLKKKILLLVSEVEGFLKLVNGGGRLLKQKLDRRVSNNRYAIGRLEEVTHVLGNGGNTQEVLPPTLHE